MPDNSTSTDLYQSGPADSDQFIRKWSLTLLGAGGQSWTISDSRATGALSGGDSTIQDALRITFQTRQGRVQSPGTADITIFNMRLENPMGGILKVGGRVVLRAGYENGRFGTIFDGMIVNFRRGRTENLTETYISISAKDGDAPYNQATVNQGYTNGQTATNVVKDLSKSMVALGATLGKIIGLSDTPFIRGVVHYGMAVDNIRKYGQMFIQNATLNVFDPKRNFDVGGPVKLNANTGLIGQAEITGPNGVDCKCLLNPTMQVQTMLIINNRDINQVTASPITDPTTGQVISRGSVQEGPAYGQIGFYIEPSADGTYAAIVIEHSGDSRGNAWETHIVAWPTDQPVLPGSTLFTDYGPTVGDVTTYTKPPQLPADPNLPRPTGPNSINQTPGV